jgi:hypothetical protein
MIATTLSADVAVADSVIPAARKEVFEAVSDALAVSVIPTARTPDEDALSVAAVDSVMLADVIFAALVESTPVALSVMLAVSGAMPVDPFAVSVAVVVSVAFADNVAIALCVSIAEAGSDIDAARTTTASSASIAEAVSVMLAVSPPPDGAEYPPYGFNPNGLCPNMA